MNEPTIIKADKRFKKGNIKRIGNKLRGNPETMELKRLELPNNPFAVAHNLNPPIVISRELAKALTEVRGGSNK